jgi:TonB family protein
LAPVPPVKSSNDVLRDVMKGVELPPDAPKFGDFSPTEKPKKAQLKLPDVPVVPDTKALPAAAPELKPRRSLTEDLTKELDEEFKKIKKLDLPKPAPLHADATLKPTPTTEAKAPSVKAVETTLKVPGGAPGSNAYLARVRQRISSFWSAPPVDVSGQTHVVVVKFRLHRNGTVSGVAIEQSSGNEYYDLAGKRAVVTAIPLPAFPADLTESYFDAHFTFMVGEQQG